MKFVKGISLYLLYPFMMLVLGFYSGVKLTHFFYPGDTAPGRHYEQENAVQPQNTGNSPDDMTAGNSGENMADSGQDQKIESEAPEPEDSGVLEAAASRETLSVDTEYVLEETNLNDHTVVETTWRIPDQYVGMNREQFLEAMRIYEAFPPLTEMERGFVNLEVLSFSRERVVIRMNYRYIQPTSSFYLAAYDNKVIVYLDDKETVFIETDILLESLPEELQSQIIQMKWIENEEELYNILESYSS